MIVSVQTTAATYPDAAERRRGAARLVLVRLGQLRLRHHDLTALFSPYSPPSPSGVPPGPRPAPRSPRPRHPGLARIAPVVRHHGDDPAVGRPAADRGGTSPTGLRTRRGCSPASPGRALRPRWACSSSPAPTGSSASPCVFVGNVCLGLVDRHLRRDPVRHLHPRRARSGLLPRLGLRLPRRRPVARRQPAVVHGHAAIGLSTDDRDRISLFSAGLWWAAFTIVPYLGLRNRPPRRGPGGGRLARQSSGSSSRRSARRAAYPDDAAFLARLPVLQRRHPDRDLRRRRSTAAASSDSA